MFLSDAAATATVASGNVAVIERVARSKPLTVGGSNQNSTERQRANS